MTATTPGKAPELLYEPSFCNQALEAAGLDVVPPETLSGLARTWPTPDRPKTSHCGPGRTGFSETRLISGNCITHESSQRLRQLRIDARKTLREVSEATGVSFWSISKYELGGVNPANANFDRISALADYYGVPVSDVLGIEATANVAQRREGRVTA